VLSPAQLLQEFVTLWVVIDPIGTLPVFLAVTTGLSAAQRRTVALRAVAISFGVLTLFIGLGQVVLDALGLALPSFQIAGGIVLFLFALTMIFGHSKAETEIAEAERVRQTAVFPVAIPSIASPGAMLTVVILTDNDRFSISHQVVTASLMGLVLICTLLILLAAAPLHRVLGTTGEAVISRVMGMVLAAVAVDAVLRGFTAIGVLPPF